MSNKKEPTVKKALIELEELTPDSSNLVSKMLKENIDFLTVKLNALVSSDIIFRNLERGWNKCLVMMMIFLMPVAWMKML